MATAVAHPNIALVKYWGKRDRAWNLPAVPSLSMTLGGFETRTTVVWGAPEDAFELGGAPGDAQSTRKVMAFLDLVDPARPPCSVHSTNTFPTGAGLASSASAFAALALAAAHAAGRTMTLEDLSALARRGSGSACRSLHGGFVEWVMGAAPDGRDSTARLVAPQDHWDLRMVVLVVDAGKKPVSSTDGMLRTQDTSPLFGGFVASAPADVDLARDAVLRRDLEALGSVMERSTFKMHASMWGASPPLRYLRAASFAVIDAVEELRSQGVGAWVTMDAGPNVKVLCAPKDEAQVVARVAPLVHDVHVLGVGGPARLVEP